MKPDFGLETLLLLDGTEYTEENGYWYRIEAYQVLPSQERPHGIRYNLTFHNASNERIMGFDNAHAVVNPRRYGGRIIVYDHVHRHEQDKGVPYEFISAQQLLKDFFDWVTITINGRPKETVQ
jgi:hypothetical protein